MDNHQIINDFIELVKVDVQSRNERQIANLLKEKLLQIGCEVAEDNTGSLIGGNAGNVIARLAGNNRFPAILLSAHMDRVKNGSNIKPVMTREKITSDGTTILAADDVAGLVCILDGLRKIKNEGIDHCPIEIVFSVCEEQGVEGSKHLDCGALSAEIAYVFDSPGNIGRIVNKAPAKSKITALIYGKSAHAGNEPETGLNAIKVAGTALAQIHEGRISSCTTANFGSIRGGEVTNIVCDYVELIGEARSTKQEELNQYLEYVKDLFSTVAAQFKTKIEVVIENHYEAFAVGETETVSTILTQALTAMGVKYHFSAGGGGMDANRFNSAGIRSLGVATGYKQNHTFDEEISVADLIKSGELVKQIIIQASRSWGW